MTFNHAEFKAAFRKRAAELGIDPTAEEDNQHAATIKAQLIVAKYASTESSFQIALKNAEQRTMYHDMTQTLTFDAHTRRHPTLFASEAMRQKMGESDWWSQDAEMWRCGKAQGRSYQISEFMFGCVENDACRNVCHEAKRLEKDRKPVKVWTMTDAKAALKELKEEAATPIDRHFLEVIS